MVVKWRCPGCTAVYDDNEALMLLLAKNFTPVEVEEPKPKPVEMPRYRPQEPKPGERSVYAPRYPRTQEVKKEENEEGEEDLNIR